MSLFKTTDDPGTAGTAGGLRGLDRRFFGPHLAARPLFREPDVRGGPEHGYLLLSDSNYDWGQGLKELARWQEKRAGPGPLAVCEYFGTDPAVDREQVRTATFHFAAREGPESYCASSRGVALSC